MADSLGEPIFDIGFPPAGAAAPEPALGMAKQTVEQLEGQIDTAIRRCLAGGTIAVGQCQGCVAQRIREMIDAASDVYSAAGYTIESAIAFELARVSADLSQLGCDMTGIAGGSPVSAGTAGTPPGQTPTVVSPMGAPGGSMRPFLPGEPGPFFTGACCNRITGECIEGLTSIECDDHGGDWQWLGPDTHCGGPEHQLLCQAGTPLPGPVPTPTPTPRPRPTPTPGPVPTPTPGPGPGPSCPAAPTCPAGTTLASIQCCPNGHESLPGGSGSCPKCCATCTPTPPPGPPPKPRFCCLNPGSLFPICQQVTEDTIGSCPAGAALFDSEAECKAACRRGGIIVPGPVPTPEPGGITTCPPPEIIVNVPPCPEPEKKKTPPPDKWKAWKRCSDGTCYITGPRESVENPADTLILQDELFEPVWNAARNECCCGPELQSQSHGSSIANILFGGIGGNGASLSLPFPSGMPSQPGGQVSACPRPGDVQPNISSTVDWNDPNVCNTLDTDDAATVQAPTLNLAQWIGLVDKDGQPSYPDAWKDKQGITGIFFRHFWGQLVGILQVLDLGRKAMSGVTGCTKPLALDAIFNEMGFGLIEHVLGAGIEDFRLRYRYTKRYFCPQELPTAAEADEAFLRNTIDEQLWRCWIRANGKLEDPWKTLRDAKRERLTLGEIINLWRRKKLKDEELATRIRELGYIKDSDVAEFRELSQEIPPISDITRFMTREVYDEHTVERFQLDTLFNERYVGTRLREWGEAQGITEEAARAYWRAHWIYASPGQLKEMYQRLRNNPDPTLQFGRQDVETLLRHQDFLPSLIPRLLEISFRPLALRQLSAGYNTGAITREEVLDGLSQIGYSDANRDILGRVFDRNKLNAARTNQWVKLYGAVGINRRVATLKLTELGYTTEQTDKVLDEANDRRDAGVREKCERAFIRRYSLGEIDDNELGKLLLGLGLDDDQARILVAQARCTKDARGKTIPAATLCRWFERGIISGVEYRRRLINLGYSEPDAIDLILDCQRSIDIKREKAAMAKLKEEQRERAKAERDRIRIAKELERAKAKIEKERKRKEKAEEKRAEVVLKASEVVAKALGAPIEEATSILSRVIERLIATYHITTDDATEDAVRAAETTVYVSEDELFINASHIVVLEAAILSATGGSDDGILVK